MAVDITNINRLTFGVNFLGDNGGKKVEALWKSRFSNREAFLVTTAPETDPKVIFEQFCRMLVQQEQTHVSGKQCMLVYFVDYTNAIPKTVEKAIWGMSKVMQDKLNCNIQAVIQFAFVGQRGQESTVQKENIKKALANNGKKQHYENYRLLLVGESVLDRNVEYNWKATIVFTDLLRRCKVMSQYLPVSRELGVNDVGFLRYGEFDQVRYRQLHNERDRLQEQLKEKKDSALRALVEEKRRELILHLESQFPINGASHPQHPDMIVPERRGFFGPNLRRAAENGNNPAYNEAVKATKAAVEETGRSISQKIKAVFDQHIAEAPRMLDEFFEKSNAGIMLKLDPEQMRSALYMQPYDAPSAMPKLAFKYSAQGVQLEIEEYLEYVKKTSIASGLNKYAEALYRAYENIPMETFRSQKEELEKALNELTARVGREKNAEEFCNWIAQNYPPEFHFDITNEMSVGNQKFLMARFVFAPLVEAATKLGTVEAHTIDDSRSGIVNFDDAPVKALMVEAVECKDWVLDHFLPEVEWDSDQEQTEEEDEFAF